ncbi:MAG: TetR/AcrR family transcriptional regulator [Microbacterium sp.]|jgi:AcrR family transcriptional regulator|uniref:TetR/AcrR family transcriptional regulator n=1 Tax=Microbacterium sp. TaxID=51671 RepID=UPI00282E81A3|nr:helix-turn-helix domain-containing protein [Microbacterium sp.]MDR2322474.1 TetR/AcrR family transcriptional regulator [Microbacterium sp.]
MPPKRARRGGDIDEALPMRARLDAGVIVSAGLELAASGAASISVRELGTRLGADPTAIYRHFRSKDDLMRALLDDITLRAVLSVDLPVEDWRGRLRALAGATLDLYSQYPAVGAEATTLTTHGPGELGAIELMLEAFTTAGLDEADVVRHYALMASHVLSTAAGIARARADRGDGDLDGPWFDEPPLADPRSHPRIAAHTVALASLRDRDLFFLGVDLVLESAERAAR